VSGGQATRRAPWAPRCCSSPPSIGRGGACWGARRAGRRDRAPFAGRVRHGARAAPRAGVGGAARRRSGKRVSRAGHAPWAGINPCVRARWAGRGGAGEWQKVGAAARTLLSRLRRPHSAPIPRCGSSSSTRRRAMRWTSRTTRRPRSAFEGVGRARPSAVRPDLPRSPLPFRTSPPRSSP
jgi:hypothetical protein